MELRLKTFPTLQDAHKVALRHKATKETAFFLFRDTPEDAFRPDRVEVVTFDRGYSLASLELIEDWTISCFDITKAIRKASTEGKINFCKNSGIGTGFLFTWGSPYRPYNPGEQISDRWIKRVNTIPEAIEFIRDRRISPDELCNHTTINLFQEASK